MSGMRTSGHQEGRSGGTIPTASVRGGPGLRRGDVITPASNMFLVQNSVTLLIPLASETAGHTWPASYAGSLSKVT